MKGDAMFELMFAEPRASELDRKREVRGQKQRLLYDCAHAWVCEDRRVRCRRNGEIDRPLRAVLQGQTPVLCQHCDYFRSSNGNGVAA